METIDVSDIARGQLLASLYNSSKPQGLGILHFTPEEMSPSEAVKLLNPDLGKPSYFDYLQGRVMKVEINGQTLDPWGYDRDNGQGAAQSVVDRIRKDPA